MKKQIAIVFATLLCVLLCACAKNDGQTEATSSENTQDNSQTQQIQPTETEEEEPISVVGEWVNVVGDIYYTYTFNADGTMTGYAMEPSSYTINKVEDKNLLTVHTGENTIEFYVVEEDGKMRLDAWDFSLVPVADASKPEGAVTFPVADTILSDAEVSATEFMQLIQIGLMGYKTVSCNSVRWDGTEFDSVFVLDETNYLVKEKFNAYADAGENLIGSVLFSSHIFNTWENVRVIDAICPTTGGTCYKLTANVSSDAVEKVTIGVYLDKETNQLVYVERIASDKGTNVYLENENYNKNWSSSKFVYSAE